MKKITAKERKIRNTICYILFSISAFCVGMILYKLYKNEPVAKYGIGYIISTLLCLQIDPYYLKTKVE